MSSEKSGRKTQGSEVARVPPPNSLGSNPNFQNSPGQGPALQGWGGSKVLFVRSSFSCRGLSLGGPAELLGAVVQEECPDFQIWEPFNRCMS